MALDYWAFDQDLTPGGWRAIADRGDCNAVVADLIARWRETHGADAPREGLSLLYFHEGQLRARADDDYASAIRLIMQSARRTGFDPPPGMPADEAAARRSNREAWNGLVDATLAYIENDRPAFEAARERMLAAPEPTASGMIAIFYEAPESVHAAITARPRPPPWFSGIEVLVRCFGVPYELAGPAACPPAEVQE